MKDIFDLLDTIQIEESQIDEKSVSEIERKRVKRSVMKSMKKKRYMKNGLVAVAVCGLVICGVGGIGVINPAYASDIPIVGDIFRFLDRSENSTYDKYKEYSHEVNYTKESNGIEITIKDTVFDGKTIYYTYEIKSDKDLSDSPFLGSAKNGAVISIKDYAGGLAGGDLCERVNGNTYVGMGEFTIDEERDKINFDLNFDNILFYDGDKEDIIEGYWDFSEISLEAIDSIKQIVDIYSEKNGVKVSIDSISKTPISFNIMYSQSLNDELSKNWSGLDTSLVVKDDLGNIYDSTSASGYRYGDIIKFTATFGKVDEKATKLIITPTVNLKSNNYKSSNNESNVKNNEIVLEDIILDDIVVELDK